MSGATEAGDGLSAQDRRIAWGLFALAFLALAFTQGDVGFVRDESVYFAAAESYASWFKLLAAAPARALTDEAIVARWDFNHEHPALMKSLFGLSFLLFHQGLGMTPALAFRLPAFAVAALIPALVYLLGRRLFGRAAGLFGGLSFLLVPRQFFNAHLACFDVPVAALWLLTIYAYVRAQQTRRGWLWCGVAWGLAIATKHNALFIPFVVAPFALYRAFRPIPGAPERERWVALYLSIHAAALLLYAVLFAALGQAQFQPRFLLLSPHTFVFAAMVAAGGYALRGLRPHSEEAFRALAPISAMAVLGPVIFFLSWPYLWHHPVDRTAWYLGFHAKHHHYTWFYLGRLLREPPFPLAYVVVKTALTVPLTLFVPMALGLGASVARALAAAWPRLRTRVQPASWEEVLVAVNAVASIAIISHPDVPHFGGVKHWFPSMPFLAILAGASVARAAGTLAGWLSTRWPGLSERAVVAALGGLLLLPAAWATARVHPYGTSAYSELAGGLPGAASLGMQRQFWSNNVTGVLEWINQNAGPGERVYLHEVNGYSFRDYQRNGMLRPDLQGAGGPWDATIAAYQYHQEFREHEMNIWQAFGTQKPAYGLYVDETPQVVVYRRR
jgi:4-amino-4-deoxy-L-arabinose transferase-like glycosyltransferase